MSDVRRILYLMRHAHASSHGEFKDRDRPLDRRGEREAGQVARMMAAKGYVPGKILCSRALRARDTAGIVARYLGLGGDRVDIIDDLYLAEPEVILAWIRRQDSALDSLMVVGHNPGMSELCEGLCTNDDYLPMSTASLNAVSCGCESWQTLRSGCGVVQDRVNPGF